MRWFGERRKRETELEREVRSHLEAEAEEQHELGLDDKQAEFAARRAFGNPTRVKEDVRSSWGWTALEQFARDVQYAIRSLRRSPGFAVTAVLSLALGIGANTAIFSVVNAVLLRPLPFPEPEQLVQLWEANPSRGYSRNVVNPINFLDWSDRTHSFDGMAAASSQVINITGQGAPVGLPGMQVSPAFFSVLKATPLIGRAFLSEEGQPGKNNVAVLGYGLWQSRFGGDRSIVGRQIRIDGAATTIIGVMPSGFRLPKTRAEIWTPLPITRSKEWAGGRWLSVIARIRSGLTLEQARHDLESVASQLARERPDFDKGWSAEAIPMLADATAEVRLPLLLLLASVGLVLMIACANATNLLLMRATGRHQEIAVRAALGASRRRLMQQLFSESLVLGAMACLFGVAVGYLALKGLLALVPEDSSFPRLDSIAMDGRVFVFAAGIAVLSAFVFGLFPALQISQVRPQQNLSLNSVRISSRGSVRRALVVLEIALSVLLLAGAGLMLRSFERLLSVNPGFSIEHVLTLNVFTFAERYHDDRKRGDYFARILEAIRNVPGVAEAGSTHFLPLESRTSGSCFALADEPPPEPSRAPSANFLVVSPGYFETMRTPLLKGRLFDKRDAFGKPSVVLVNQQFVRQYLTGREPIGEKLNACWTVPNPVQIVGVVADARQTELQQAPKPTIFLANSQAPMYFAQFVVRTPGDPIRLRTAIEKAIHQIDPDQAVTSVKTLEQVYSDSVAQPRLEMILLGAFAGLAALLAIVGIYGVISYSVAQRRREIGIRMALGAQLGDVSWGVLKEGLLLGTVGGAIGLAAALAFTRLLQTLLFETKPNDVTTLLSAVLIAFVAVLAASTLPAYRAAQTDPVTALRYE
jgi:putative ABC transport system permease protein